MASGPNTEPQPEDEDDPHVASFTHILEVALEDHAQLRRLVERGELSQAEHETRSRAVRERMEDRLSAEVARASSAIETALARQLERNANGDAFADKAAQTALATSGASIAASIAFAGSQGAPEHLKWLLIAAWLMLTGSIIGVIWLRLLGAASYRLGRDDSDELFATEFRRYKKSPVAQEVSFDEYLERRMLRHLRLAPKLVYLPFLLGLSALLAFYSLTIPEPAHVRGAAQSPRQTNHESNGPHSGASSAPAPSNGR